MHFLLLLPPLANKAMTPSPPVGLAYLAAVLKSKSIQVSTITPSSDNLELEQTVQNIIDKKPDVLAITVSTPAFNNTVTIAKRVKKSLYDVKIISGGPHATLFPADMIHNGIDIVVRGEGEQTIADLIRYFEGKTNIASIDGISYKHNGQIVNNKQRALIKDLDNIPFPAWEFFPIKKYESLFKKSKISLPVLTSRGCPGRCTFCYKGIFGSRLRVRSPENVLKEVVYLKDSFQIEEFSIIDDCFTIIPRRTIEFCNLMLKNEIRIPWTLPAGIRVDTASEELFRKLKEAGCYRVGFGIETGNADIMKSIKKGITLEQAQNAVALSKKFGIECTGNFMIGNLNESLKTVNDSIQFAIELDPDYAQFTRAIPFPGSEMYDTLLKDRKIISENWDDYDYLLTDKQIFMHDQLSHEQIQQKMKAAYRKFYLRPSAILREMKKKLSQEGLRKLIRTVPFALKRFLK